MRLVTIDAPHFNAGLVFRKNRVDEAAPILSYMVGWSPKRVRAYAKKKRWSFYAHPKESRSDDPPSPLKS